MARERLSLLIDSQTRGSQEVEKLEKALNRVTDAADRSTRKSAAATKKSTSDLSGFQSQIQQLIRDPLGAARNSAEQFASSLGKTGIIAAGAVAGFAALGVASVSLVKNLGDAAKNLNDFADRTGLSLDQVDRLQAMAKIAGVNVNTLEQSSIRVGQAISGVGEASKQARLAVRQLGVSMFTTTGRQREMADVTIDILRALSEMESHAKRVALANEVLGEGGRELIPLIKGYADLEERVEELGFGMEANLLKQLAATREEMIEMELVWERVKRQLGVTVSPVIDVVLRVTEENPTATLLGLTPDILKPFLGARLISQRGGAEQGQISAVNKTAESERQARADAARRFVQGTLQTREGLQSRLLAVGKERGDLGIKLESPELNLTSRKALEADLAALDAEKKSIDTRLKALAEHERTLSQQAAKAEAAAKKIAVFRARIAEGMAPGLAISAIGGRVQWQIQLRQTPGLPTGSETLGFQTQQFQTGLQSRIREDETAVRNINRALVEVGREQTDARRQQLDATRALVELDIRRISLGSSEVETIEKAASLRLGLLADMKAAGVEQFEIDLERTRILIDREEQLRDIRRRGVEEYRAMVVSAFDALISGGRGGLSSFVRSQGLGVIRGIVGNLASETFSATRGRLTIPGQGSSGSPNLFGRLLAGTPFGMDPLKTATDMNTVATVENTAALRGASLQLGGRGIGIPGGVFQGAAGPLGAIFSATNGPVGFGADTLDYSFLNLPSSRGSGFANLWRGLGIAGAAAGGTFGVAAGLRQGGFRGGLAAGASGAGAASALLPLLGVAGPAAPILAGGALAASLIGTLLPDPKRQRAEQLDLRIESAKIELAGPTEFRITGAGSGFDRNFLGEFRPVVIVNQGSLDEDEIADSVRNAMQRGHRINETAREVVLAM